MRREKPSRFRKTPISRRGQRTAWTKPTAGEVSTGPAWTEVSSHAAERFADRFCPDMMLDEATDLLLELGKDAVLFGEAQGGRMFFCSRYPMCSFLVRDTPGALISVFDRKVEGGLTARVHAEMRDGELSRIDEGEVLEEQLPPCVDGERWNRSCQALVSFHEALQCGFRSADPDAIFASREDLVRHFDEAIRPSGFRLADKVLRHRQVLSLIFLEIGRRQAIFAGASREQAAQVAEEKMERISARVERWKRLRDDPRSRVLQMLTPGMPTFGSYGRGVQDLLRAWYPPALLGEDAQSTKTQNKLLQQMLSGGRFSKSVDGKTMVVLGWSGHIGVLVREKEGKSRDTSHVIPWMLDVFLPPPFECQRPSSKRGAIAASHEG